jgi:NAD dependent epimerase/dehydratase family enzyme
VDPPRRRRRHVPARDRRRALERRVNVSAPSPVTNKEFSKALGRALKRPAVSPVPAFAIKTLYGEMSTIVLNGVNMIPARATGELGYAFAHPEVDEALTSTLGR